MSMCGSVKVSTGACGSQRKILDPRKLNLHGVVSCPTWVLETELGSSARAIGEPSLQPLLYVFVKSNGICYLASISIQTTCNIQQDNNIHLDTNMLRVCPYCPWSHFAGGMF